MSDQTKTSIVNQALREIGSYRVDDIDTDPGADAQVARDIWETCRRFALSCNEWRFATRTVQLAQLAIAPVGPYAVAYAMPSDLIYLGAVANTSTLDPPLREWDVMDNVLFAKDHAIFISYTYDHITTGLWPAWFVDYMVALLAARMASALKSTTERQRLEDLAMKRQGYAKSADGSQQPVRRQPEGDWVRSMHTRAFGR